MCWLSWEDHIMFPLSGLKAGVARVKAEYPNQLDYNGLEKIKKTLLTAKKRYSITGELLNMSSGRRETWCMVILYNPILSVYPSSSTTYREI